MVNYSLTQDLQNKITQSKYLLKKRSTILQLISSLDSGKLASDTDKKEKFIAEKNQIPNQLQTLNTDIANMLFLCDVIKSCWGPFHAINYFYVLQKQLFLNTDVAAEDFLTLYTQIKKLFGEEGDEQHLKGKKSILFFLNKIGLNNTDYHASVEKWRDNFFKDNPMHSNNTDYSPFVLNKIYNKYHLFYRFKFEINLEQVRDELLTILRYDLHASLADDYQWFGLFIFIYYEVMDNFFRSFIVFKSCDEFTAMIYAKIQQFKIQLPKLQELTVKTHINEKIIFAFEDSYSQISTKLVAKISFLKKICLQIKQDTAHNLSYAKALSYLQKMMDYACSNIISLSVILCEIPYFKKLCLFFKIDEKNIITLLELFLDKFKHSEKEVKSQQCNHIHTNFSDKYSVFFSCYSKIITESVEVYVLENQLDRAKQAGIFLDLLSSDIMGSKEHKYALYLLISSIKAIANMQYILFKFINIFLMNVTLCIEENFLIFIEKRSKELIAGNYRDELLEENFLLIYNIEDTLPFLNFLDAEKIKKINVLKQKHQDISRTLERKPSPNKLKKTLMLQHSPKLSQQSNTKLDKKTVAHHEFLSQLKQKFTELNTNALTIFNYIENYPSEYKKINELKKFIDKFNSALGQIDACLMFFKKKLNISSPITIEKIFNAIDECLLLEHSKHKQGTQKKIFKKENTRYAQSKELIINKVKHILLSVNDAFTKLKKEKDYFIANSSDNTDKNLSRSIVKKIDLWMKSYDHLTHKLSLLYNLLQKLSLEDELQATGLLPRSIDDLREELAKARERLLNLHTRFLQMAIHNTQTTVTKEKVKERASTEEATSMGLQARTVGFLPTEAAGCLETCDNSEESFEQWQTDIEKNINQIVNIIRDTSLQLVSSLHPLFVKIFEFYQKKIDTKQFECLEKSSFSDEKKLFCDKAHSRLKQWLRYINDHKISHNADENFLFFLKTDYLAISTKIKQDERQLVASEKLFDEKLFNLSQSFLRPLFYNNEAYELDLAQLHKQTSEIDSESNTLSALKEHLIFTKYKRQSILEQLSHKADGNALKDFVKRVDPGEALKLACCEAIELDYNCTPPDAQAYCVYPTFTT